MPASFDHSLPMILYRTLEQIMPAYKELFARYQLTEQQWRILRVLWESETVTTTQLAQRTLLPQPSLVGILDRLEKKGLTLRDRSKTDRRVTYIRPTPKGLALGEEIVPQVDLIDHSIRASISELNWAAMEKSLSTISKFARDEKQAKQSA